MDKLLTIAIPTFNRKECLLRLIESIGTEYLDDIEIFVSDNASTDGTQEVIKKKEYIRYFHQEKNEGAIANIWNCYMKATGSYVWIVGDDDIITGDSVLRVISFLKKHKQDGLSIVFLNHCFFEGEYDESKEYPAFFPERNNDYVTDNKELFISVVKEQFSFISSFVVNCEMYRACRHLVKINQMVFNHSGIAFAVTEESHCMGIIEKCCVAQDLTPGQATFAGDYSSLFYLFGNALKSTYVDFAVTCGYKRKQMLTIYKKAYLRKFFSWLLRSKGEGNKKSVKAFWQYCFPAVKQFAWTWCFLVPLAVLPSGFSRFVLTKIRPMLR